MKNEIYTSITARVVENQFDKVPPQLVLVVTRVYCTLVDTWNCARRSFNKALHNLLQDDSTSVIFRNSAVSKIQRVQFQLLLQSKNASYTSTFS